MKNTVIKNWKKIIKKLQVDNQIPEVSYRTWIKPLEVVKVENGIVYIRFPFDVSIDFVSKKYSQPLKVCIAEVTGQEYDVKLFTYEDDIKKCTVENSDNKTETYEEIALNPQYTFETFVVSESNNFAHAASIAVAESPCEIYNPLVLYGERGSGKTHLMQAIAHFIMKKHSDKKVLYVHGKTFANDFAKVTMKIFRSKYQSIDVLLVDDIQPIIKDETLQEEFFHIFNYLHSRGKHVIVSSDKSPKDMGGLQNRLRVCLEWGLLADISLPDNETKKAILRKKEEYNK